MEKCTKRKFSEKNTELCLIPDLNIYIYVLYVVNI